MKPSAASPQTTGLTAGPQVVSASVSEDGQPGAAELYHSDAIHDGPPSLSASIAHLMLSRSPAHARMAHPRLNPDWQPDHDPKFDLGTVVHQVLLQGDENIVVVPEDSWRSNAAKEAREEAWRVHTTALLEKDWARVLEMVQAIWAQLEQKKISPPPFVDGRAEVPMVWDEPNGVRCRALVDWLHDGNLLISDLKTTRASANPAQWCRTTLWAIGADIQVAAHSRAVHALTGVLPEFRYVVVECEPPYELSVVGLAPSALEIGQRKWARAVELWGECMESGVWPGYPSKVAYAELPAWEEMRWLEMEAREAA